MLEMNKIKEIKPLIIGIGVAGKRHLEAQLNLGFITGVYTTNPQTVKSLRKQKEIIVFENLEDGLDWANLVHVCTPDDTHSEFVAKAIKKGKTVICEKSFTTSFKDALFLQNLAHKHDIKVFVGQNYRLTPTFVEIRKRVLNGQLGIISQIETTYFHDRNDYQKRYQGKNFLYTGGSHAVDLASWIVGERIVSVQVFSENELKYNIEVEFSTGLKGNIKLDANSPRSLSGTDLIIQGERGRLVSYNKSDKLLFFGYGNEKNQTMILPNTKSFTIPSEIKIIDDYLLGKTTSYSPLPEINEAVYLIKILDTIKQAIFSGKNEKV